MNLAIRGLASASPAFSIENNEAVEIAKTMCGNHDLDRHLPVLYRRSGVRNRASALLDGPQGHEPRQTFFPPSEGPEFHGPTTGERMQRYAIESRSLAKNAAQSALNDAEISAAQVTHLVTVSCTGFNAPGFDISLFEELELNPSVERTHLGFMGCHGALNALRVAKAIVTAYPNSCVLVCAVELCSLHFHYGTDPEQMVANSLFADGAAAVVCTSDSSARDADWRIGATGSSLFPDSQDAMTWSIGDHGFEMTLSSRVPDLIQANLSTWLHKWLESHGLRQADIGCWAIHPGGPRILRAVAGCLQLPDEAVAPSLEILAQHGNMSSPTILYLLELLRQRDAPLPGVAIGFGPGLVVEAAILV